MGSDFLELFWRIVVALAVGLLLGLERGWQLKDLPEGQRAAGIRTFALVGVTGGLAAALESHAGLSILAIALVLISLLVLFLVYEGWRAGHLGITTEVAILFTFMLGATAGFGELALAGSLAVLAAVLLGYKQPMHAFVEKLRHDELLAVLKLLVLSVVLLPVLPNEGYGPYDALNPYKLWWMVVLVATISSAGYFAMRWFGAEKGLLATALFGGLASSTAVTVALARRAKASPEFAGPTAGAALLASAVVGPRVALLVYVVAEPLLWRLAWPLLGLVIGSLAGTFLLWRGRAEKTEELPLGNPFELGPALKFGLLLAIIMMAAEALPRWLGDSGVIAVGALAGMTDVDAISLSLATQVNEGHIAVELAAWGVLAAVGVNTLVKTGIGWVLGGTPFGWRMVAGNILTLALAAGALFLPALGGEAAAPPPS
ncbi:MAG TPA: MgtC/SapB family protein [Kiloniellales bacterium]|nr:MgtC/SapB family protein [Kiloniellales bacterium]